MPQYVQCRAKASRHPSPDCVPLPAGRRHPSDRGLFRVVLKVCSWLLFSNHLHPSLSCEGINDINWQWNEAALNRHVVGCRSDGRVVGDRHQRFVGLPGPRLRAQSREYSPAEYADHLCSGGGCSVRPLLSPGMAQWEPPRSFVLIEQSQLNRIIECRAKALGHPAADSYSVSGGTPPLRRALHG